MNRRTGVSIVALVAIALYLPSLRNGFAYDDVAIIQLDERVHSLRQIPAILTTPYWRNAELGLYRPLATLSYALDWTVSGGSTTWFHLVNVLWNAAACSVLFLLLALMVPAGPALAGALLFAVHPLHVEAVANVVGRAELMAATFVLAAVYLWARPIGNPVPSRRTLIGITTLFALALLSKESAIMLPALLVIADAGRGRLTPQNMKPWLQANTGLLVALTVVAAAYMLARTAVIGEIGPGRVAAALEVVGPFEQRLTALQIWPIIVSLLFAPVVLLADYAPRVIMPATGFALPVLLGITILGGLVLGGTIAWKRGHGWLALTLLWLPLAVLPVANLIVPIGVLLAERALYLPSAALALAIGFAGARVTNVKMRRAAIAALVLTGGIFAVRSLGRIPEWRSTDTILAALLRDRPEAYGAHWHAARIDARAGRAAAALERYGQALELWPFRRGLVYEAAAYAARVNELEYARRLATYMLQRWPADLEAGRLLAGTALDMGDSATARHTITRMLVAHPADSILMRMREAVARDTLP